MTGRANCIDSASMREAIGSLDSQWTLPFKKLREAFNFNLDFRRDENESGFRKSYVHFDTSDY